jgi:mannose-6-phosphate isomerase
MADSWLERPWRLLPNRIPRFYRGGRLLDAFRGALHPVDTDRPEDWLGSATRAWTPPGEGPTDEGLGSAEVDDAARRVADVLRADPIGVAGPELAGLGTTGILVKLLDAGIRLPVHLHPTRPFARDRLGSPFGKAEAWIVLGTRDVPGEPPAHVRLGFRRDVGRDELRRWIDDERAEALLDALHDAPTTTGDIWFVPPGTPHAIGAGVFILEVQEPTDFSIVLETAGFPIDAADAHLGLGWDLVLDAVDRRPLAADGFAALRSTLEAGLPAAATPFFAVERIRLGAGEARSAGLPDRFVVGVVIAGSGAATTSGGKLLLDRGDTFAVPAAAVAGLALVAAEDGIDVLACFSGGAPRPQDR